jgi:hypothetical protein
VKSFCSDGIAVFAVSSDAVEYGGLEGLLVLVVPIGEETVEFILSE